MNNHMTLLLALAMRDRQSSAAEAMLLSSSSIAAVPRMFLTLQREDRHARELEQRERAAEERLDAIAAELGDALAKQGTTLDPGSVSAYIHLGAFLKRIPAPSRPEPYTPGEPSPVKASEAAAS